MKVGIGINLVNTRFGPGFVAQAGLRTAQATGCDSLWVSDHLNSLLPRAIMTPAHTGVARIAPDVDACPEPWTVLGALAAGSRFRRIRLATGVTDASRRHPAVTAQAAATLHLMTRGRAILGIGTGEMEGNAPYGVDWSRPVARFIEALATIRALWDSGGELVTRDSEWFPLRDASFTLPPYQGGWPQIWVAAHGPRMLRATGRYADAWLPGFLFTPHLYADGLEQVRAAADDAGRDPAGIVAANWFFVVTGRSRGEVDDVLNSTVARAFALTASAADWARHGTRHPMGDDFAGANEILPQLLDEATVLEYTRVVPESLLRETILAGTSDEILDQLAEWRHHGLGYGVFTDISMAGPSLRRGLAAGLPFARILRGARRL